MSSVKNLLQGSRGDIICFVSMKLGISPGLCYNFQEPTKLIIKTVVSVNDLSVIVINIKI